MERILDHMGSGFEGTSSRTPLSISLPLPITLPLQVQQAATAAVAGFSGMMSPAAQAAALRKYSRLAATPLPAKVQPPAVPVSGSAPDAAAAAAWDAYRTKRAAGEEETEGRRGAAAACTAGDSSRLVSRSHFLPPRVALARRRAGACGLSALVLGSPFDVPRAVPAALSALARLAADPPPTPGLVRHAFSEFKRTHQDGWERHRTAFDADQLADLTDLLVSPSYYA